jgi:hypothetical protein
VIVSRGLRQLMLHFVMINPRHYDDDGYPITMVPLGHSLQHAGMDERPGGGRTRPERAWTRCQNPPAYL